MNHILPHCNKGRRAEGGEPIYTMANKPVMTCQDHAASAVMRPLTIHCHEDDNALIPEGIYNPGGNDKLPTKHLSELKKN